jgi:hypothetical protein
MNSMPEGCLGAFSRVAMPPSTAYEPPTYLKMLPEWMVFGQAGHHSRIT